MGLKNEFETAVVNEPSVVEPLKFYYIYCIPSSEFNAYLKQVKVILSASKKYRILH